MHISQNELPVTVEMPGYVGKWTELADLHFAFETCAAGSNIDDMIYFPLQGAPG